MINPGLEHGEHDHRRRRAHGRHARGADRRPGDERLPAPGRALVRGGGGVPARLRDRVPDARHAGAAAARASGCSSGASAAASRPRRSRSRRRSARRRSSPRRATRSSSGRASSAPTRRSTTRRGDVRAAVKEATGGAGVDVVVEHVGEATWQTSLAGRAPGRAHRRLRRDDRPEPAGGAASHLVEAAVDPRLDDGHARGLRGAYELVERPREAGRRLGLPAGRGPRRARAAGGRRAVRQDRALDPVGLGGFGGMALVAGVRWSFRGKDAGSVRTGSIRARLRTQHRGEQRGPAAQPRISPSPPTSGAARDGLRDAPRSSAADSRPAASAAPSAWAAAPASRRLGHALAVTAPVASSSPSTGC